MCQKQGSFAAMSQTRKAGYKVCNPSTGKPIRRSDKQHRCFKLANNAGDNNCFLNVVIQNFWHMEAMRQTLKSVIRWEHPVHPGAKVNQVFYQLSTLCNQILDADEQDELTVDLLK